MQPMPPPAAKRRTGRCCLGCVGLSALASGGCFLLAVIMVLVGLASLDLSDIHIELKTGSSSTGAHSATESTPVPVEVRAQRDLSERDTQAFIASRSEDDRFSDLLALAEREALLTEVGFAQIVNWAYGATPLSADLTPAGAAFDYSGGGSATVVATGEIALIETRQGAASESRYWLLRVEGMAEAPVLRLFADDLEVRFTRDSVDAFVAGRRVAGILLAGWTQQAACTTGSAHELAALLATRGAAAASFAALTTGMSAYFTVTESGSRKGALALFAGATMTSILLMPRYDEVEAAFTDDAPVVSVSDPQPYGEWWYYCSEDARSVMRAPWYDYDVTAQDDRDPPPAIYTAGKAEGQGATNFLVRADQTQSFYVVDCGGNRVEGSIAKLPDRIQQYERCDGQTCTGANGTAHCQESADREPEGDVGGEVVRRQGTLTLAYTGEDARLESGTVTLSIPADGGRVTGSFSAKVINIIEPGCAPDVLDLWSDTLTGTYNQAAGTMFGTFEGTLGGRTWIDCKVGDEYQTMPLAEGTWSARVTNGIDGTISIALREGDSLQAIFQFELDALR